MKFKVVTQFFDDGRCIIRPPVRVDDDTDEGTKCFTLPDQDIYIDIFPSQEEADKFLKHTLSEDSNALT